MESQSSTANAEPKTCPDCKAPIAPANPPAPNKPRHCSACGQRLAPAPLTVRHVAGSTIHNLLSFDTATLRTLRGLMRGPGRVARAWIDGRRTTYINPVSFVFVVSLIIALSYEPLIRLRHSMHGAGAALYTVGLEGKAPIFSLFGILLPLPIAWAIAIIGRLAQLQRPWLEWYVLGAYATGMGALLQLTFKVVCLPLPSAWSGWLALAEFLLPIALLAWGAFHLVRPERRWHAFFVATLTPPLLMCAFALVNWLSTLGT